MTFSTDIFHPLVSPLSNYNFSADAQDNSAVSASTEERLPPGGFSLRHGFPGWFTRKASAASNPPQTPPRAVNSAHSTPQSKPTPSGETPGYMRVGEEGVSTYDLLEYIRSAFADEEVLDAVNVEAAGDSGAWYAWRTHRRTAGKAFEGEGEEEQQREAAPPGHPGSWDWAGVWEDRVTKGIAASLSEAVLYGGAGGADDVVSDVFLQGPFHSADVCADWVPGDGGERRGDDQGEPRQDARGPDDVKAGKVTPRSARWLAASMSRRSRRQARPGGCVAPGSSPAGYILRGANRSFPAFT